MVAICSLNFCALDRLDVRELKGSSVTLISSMSEASGCIFFYNNPGGRCPHP